MFIFLDRQKERLSRWLKITTTIDFWGWVIAILFMSGFGFLVVLFLKASIDLSALISNGVLWFTAIMILLYTMETYRLRRTSERQLLQNEREEFVRNRAYLAVQNCHLDFNRNEIDQRNKKIIFTLANKGMTPAQKIIVRKYFTSPAPNEKRFGEYPVGASRNYLVPNHIHRYQFPATDWDLNFASEISGSEKFLAIEVTYFDYHKQKHILTSYYQVRSKEPQSSLILKERYEEDS